MTQPVSRSVVLAFYKAYAERDPHKIASFVAEDCEWVVAGPAALLPFCGVHRGRAAIVDMFSRQIPSVYQFKGFDPEELLIDGDRVAMYGKMFGVLHSSGRTIRYRHAQFLRFKDDKIVWFRAVLDSFDLAEQLLGHPICVEDAPGLAADGNLITV